MPVHEEVVPVHEEVVSAVCLKQYTSHSYKQLPTEGFQYLLYDGGAISFDAINYSTHSRHFIQLWQCMWAPLLL